MFLEQKTGALTIIDRFRILFDTGLGCKENICSVSRVQTIDTTTDFGSLNPC